ncbi:hypothetical protein ACLOJK_007231 [Asimina triloba]
MRRRRHPGRSHQRPSPSPTKIPTAVAAFACDGTPPISEQTPAVKRLQRQRASATETTPESSIVPNHRATTTPICSIVPNHRATTTPIYSSVPNLDPGSKETHLCIRVRCLPATGERSDIFEDVATSIVDVGSSNVRQVSTAVTTEEDWQRPKDENPSAAIACEEGETTPDLRHCSPSLPDPLKTVVKETHLATSDLRSDRGRRGAATQIVGTRDEDKDVVVFRRQCKRGASPLITTMRRRCRSEQIHLRTAADEWAQRQQGGRRSTIIRCSSDARDLVRPQDKPEEMDDKTCDKLNRQACYTIRLCLAKDQKYFVMKE